VKKDPGSRLQPDTRRLGLDATSGIFKFHYFNLEGDEYGESPSTTINTMSKAREQAIAASYKALKEDFVSNLTGGEIGEINYVTAVAPVSLSPNFKYILLTQARQH
jgi:hypothetical protein